MNRQELKDFILWVLNNLLTEEQLDIKYKGQYIRFLKIK